MPKALTAVFILGLLLGTSSAFASTLSLNSSDTQLQVIAPLPTQPTPSLVDLSLPTIPVQPRFEVCLVVVPHGDAPSFEFRPVVIFHLLPDTALAGDFFGNPGLLYYYNARFYDPTLGRFITEDPARSGGNWYEYALDNPLTNIDPTGLFDMSTLGTQVTDSLKAQGTNLANAKIDSSASGMNQGEKAQLLADLKDQGKIKYAASEDPGRITKKGQTTSVYDILRSGMADCTDEMSFVASVPDFSTERWLSDTALRDQYFSELVPQALPFQDSRAWIPPANTWLMGRYREQSPSNEAGHTQLYLGNGRYAESTSVKNGQGRNGPGFCESTTRDQVVQVAEIYLQSSDSKWDDRDWQEQAQSLIVHPDENPMGNTNNYSVQLEWRSSSIRTNIYLSAKITEVFKSMEHSDGYKPKGTLEGTYFVRIDYDVVGGDDVNEVMNGQRKTDIGLYDKALKRWEYLVLAKDDTGQFKIIDHWPTSREGFLSVKVALNSDFGKSMSETTLIRLQEYQRLREKQGY